MVKLDICGQHYVEKLENGYFAPTINDMLQQGKKHVGMEYLTYSKLYDVYYICILKENTPGKYIKSLIDRELIFINPSNTYLNAN